MTGAEFDPAIFLGPAGAVVFAIAMVWLFYTGRILPRNAVPREDYKVLQEVNASYAEAFKTQTTTMNELVIAVRTIQKNGGVG